MPPAVLRLTAGRGRRGCSFGYSTWRQPSRDASTAAEHAVDRLNDGANVIIGDAVMDGLAVPPCIDQAVRAQPRQLLRHRWLSQRQHSLEFGDGFFALAQDAEDHQPALMRERLEQ